jgi:hypothetical protein
VLVGKEQPGTASAPSTQKPLDDAATSQQEQPPTSARGKKRKATGEASADAIDLEYAEAEAEVDDAPIEILEDDEDDLS